MPEFRRVRLINPRTRRSRSTRRQAVRNSRGRFVRSSAARRATNTRPRRTATTNPPRRRAIRSGYRNLRPRQVRRVPRPGARARTRNPLGEELILLSNPRRNRTRRPTTRRRRRVAVTNPYRTSRRRPNSYRSSRRRPNPHRSSRRRYNPVTREGAKKFAIEATKAVVSGALSAVATRATVQAMLGDKNVGMTGYLSNLAVALGGGYAIWYFTKSKAISLGWAVGGAAGTVQRIWSEKVSMTSPAAAAPALGDLDYSSNGLGGVGMSGYVNTGYALPSVTGPDGTIQQPFQPQLPAVAAAAGSPSLAAGVSPRFAPRY